MDEVLRQILLTEQLNHLIFWSNAFHLIIVIYMLGNITACLSSAVLIKDDTRALMERSSGFEINRYSHLPVVSANPYMVHHERYKRLFLNGWFLSAWSLFNTMLMILAFVALFSLMYQSRGADINDRIHVVLVGVTILPAIYFVGPVTHLIFTDRFGLYRDLIEFNLRYLSDLEGKIMKARLVYQLILDRKSDLDDNIGFDDDGDWKPMNDDEIEEARFTANQAEIEAAEVLRQLLSERMVIPLLNEALARVVLQDGGDVYTARNFNPIRIIASIYNGIVNIFKHRGQSTFNWTITKMVAEGRLSNDDDIVPEAPVEGRPTLMSMHKYLDKIQGEIKIPR